MKPPSKALTAKRQRLLRSLDAHLRWLRVLESLAPWTPPERQERPPRPLDPDPYRCRPASFKFSPREKPELKYPCPGQEALSEEEIKAWVEIDPFVRNGLRPATQRAMAFIATFAPARKA